MAVSKKPAKKKTTAKKKSHITSPAAAVYVEDSGSIIPSVKQIPRGELQSPTQTSVSIATDTNITVSTDEIGDVVGSHFEQQVRRQITAGQKLIKELEKQAELLVEQVAEKIQGQVDKLADTKSKKIYAAYEALDLDKEKFGFNGTGNTEDDKKTKASTEVAVRVEFYSHATTKNDYYDKNKRTTHNSLYWATSFELDEETAQLNNERFLIGQKLEQVKEQVLDWRRRQGEIPSVIRAAKARITKATLARTETGVQIYNTLVDGMQDELFEGLDTLVDLSEMETFELIEAKE